MATIPPLDPYISKPKVYLVGRQHVADEELARFQENAGADVIYEAGNYAVAPDRSRNTARRSVSGSPASRRRCGPAVSCPTSTSRPI